MSNDIFSRWTEVINKVLAQVFSGRWLITMGAIYCFVKLTDTLCDQIKADKITLEAATYVAIIMAILNTIGSIVMFYFSKNRPADNGNGENGDTTTTTTSGQK